MRCANLIPHAAAGVVLAFALLVSARNAAACTCGGPNTYCGTLPEAAAIFEATVDSVTDEAVPGVVDAPGTISSASRVNVARLKDITPLRGAPQPTVLTPWSSEMCGYEFVPGTRYLIVATRANDGRLEMTICGPTRPLSEAKGAVEFVKLIDRTNQTFVYGRVMADTGWRRHEPDRTPVEGARVTLSGPSRVTVKTDAGGFFVAKGLPYGQYVVTAEKSRGQRFEVLPSELFGLFAEEPHACMELNIREVPTGRISGTVIDDLGPREGVPIELEVAEQSDNENGGGGWGTHTDANGAFAFDELPPGRYTVGFNLGERLRGFPTAVGRTASGATVIEIKRGRSVTLQPIRLPTPQ